jgi:hypothetical protein
MLFPPDLISTFMWVGLFIIDRSLPLPELSLATTWRLVQNPEHIQQQQQQQQQQ